MLPLQASSRLAELLSTGLVYFSGRDYLFRPLVVVNAKKIIEMKLKDAELLEVLGFFYQYLIENCLIEGQVENWITLIDLGYCGVFSVGGALMDIIKHLSSIFRVRSRHNYLVKCPSSIRFIWKMVKKVLNEDQLRKITILEKDGLREEDF